MGRTAKAYLYGLQIITIETDLADSSINYKFDVKGRERGGNKDLAPELWDYLFGLYIVDKQDRLVYLYEPLGSTAKSLAEDIKTIANNPHPSAEEIFDTVDIIDEETGEVLKTLHNVNLLGILEGIKEVMGDGKNVIRDT